MGDTPQMGRLLPIIFCQACGRVELEDFVKQTCFFKNHNLSPLKKVNFLLQRRRVRRGFSLVISKPLRPSRLCGSFFQCSHNFRWHSFLLLTLLFGTVACQNSTITEDENVQATVDTAVSLTVAAQDAPAANNEVAQVTISPTWTAVPTESPATATTASTLPPPPTSTPPPTSIPIPTNTPIPTATASPTTVPPTAGPTQPPPPPTVPPEPVFSGNILANGSFEEGWYHLNGAPEFQLPNNWNLSFDSGPTGFGSQSWDKWFPPEIRVLPRFQLPDNERDLFVRNGEYTIKAFKGNGPISLRLTQDIALQPGTYRLTVHIYPDLVASYDGGKQFSSDPGAGEILFVSPNGTGWMLFSAFGTWNTFEHLFTIDTAQTVQVGVGMRGRYALPSNGFFFDDWSLQRVEN